MHILIAHDAVIPVTNYGGIERVNWYLAKELVKLGHKVTFLARMGSTCDFAKVVVIDPSKKIIEQIPDDVDVAHLSQPPYEQVSKPYIVTHHVNSFDEQTLDVNTVFVSRNHAERFGSDQYVYNGMDWDDYGPVQLNNTRRYFHFLGNAAWRVKNVSGAIKVINKTRGARLKVLGGARFNFKMGLRFTFSPKISFYGMVGGQQKLTLLQGSKGLVFPVRWHEPFGIAVTESLYCGCPVFGTPYGALPELVNEDVGYLSASSNELSEKLLQVDNYSRKRCHEYARELFNSKLMAERYIEKYETVLRGKTLNPEAPSFDGHQQVKNLPWG